MTNTKITQRHVSFSEFPCLQHPDGSNAFYAIYHKQNFTTTWPGLFCSHFPYYWIKFSFSYTSVLYHSLWRKRCGFAATGILRSYPCCYLFLYLYPGSVSLLLSLGFSLFKGRLGEVVVWCNAMRCDAMSGSVSGGSGRGMGIGGWANNGWDELGAVGKMYYVHCVMWCVWEVDRW